MEFSRSNRMDSMYKNYLLAQAKRDNSIAKSMESSSKINTPVRTTGQVLGDLSFIIQIKNNNLVRKEYLLWDADDQYILNDPNAPTNSGIDIVGTKKNYQGILNQLVSSSYRITGVNFEVTAGSSSQLDNPIKIWTSSPDNDANIYQKSINPSLYKNSQQYQLNLIETGDDLELNLFSAWTSFIEPSAIFTMRIFASSGVAFK